MITPRPDQFAAFFEAVHGHSPFPWQVRLAQRVCGGDWPRAIALPTAAGKTACLDIAVFALACGSPNAPRRVLFVVDRRLVVDQAKRHADHLANVLADATESDGILRHVADTLRYRAQPDDPASARPLEAYALRGGMYRESAWARSPLQPTIIASTVDQVGSRMLFRGYGVSDSMKPVHAGLLANDAIILLDEAHCARPFEQTVRGIQHYRNWHQPGTPLHFVSITATPSAALPATQLERADEQDRSHPVLGKRINAHKPTRLSVAKGAKGKNGTTKLVQQLEEEALALAVDGGCVGIIVNRVKTARQLYSALTEKSSDAAVLLTGRMRPLDRDDLYQQRLQAILSNADPNAGPPPAFVIGTQTLEVGADFDFNALVCECASLDALRQRFGRLNRIAKRQTDPPSPIAAVVIREDQLAPQDDEKKQDPIYGNALANTWQWLNANASDGVFDFGIAAVESAIARVDMAELNVDAPDAPTLFPAYLDCWVQTHPIPTPDPDPALFLHGPANPGQPDVQVAFRNDLGTDPNCWADIVSLCPPSSSELLRVPIGVFKRWVAGDKLDDDSGDIEGREGIGLDETSDTEYAHRTALAWRGPGDSAITELSVDVKPNTVYVVPCEADAAKELGDFYIDPNSTHHTSAPKDHAERAYQAVRDKPILRLPELKLMREDGSFEDDLSQAVRQKLGPAKDAVQQRVLEMLCDPSRRVSEPYPAKSDWVEGPREGWVVAGKGRLYASDPTFLPDTEPTDSYRAQQPVTLDDHARGVATYARRFALGCGLDADLYQHAGLWHDLGKLDPRFQAMLSGRSPRTAVGRPLAKSARPPQNQAQREQARLIHRYPKGSRHELLSLTLASQHTSDDLLLHLIATHHGSARPFFDPIDDDGSVLTAIDTAFLDQRFQTDSCTADLPASNAQSAARFWRVVRRLGWWGAAYHEAILRLADHAQSRQEQETNATTDATEISSLTAFIAPPPSINQDPVTLPLPGLDGSNPLAFLAALGTLLICEHWAKSDNRPDWLRFPPKLHWGDALNPHTPVLYLTAPQPAPDLFAQQLADHLVQSHIEHPAHTMIEILGDKNADTAKRIRDSFTAAGSDQQLAMDWSTALACEASPVAASQLQTVRKDYLVGNLKSIISNNRASHLTRTLFNVWDYADALNNQSLHWEPTEDRRHAYQWFMPSGDPTRSKHGGMLGANRLALEAWPLFPSFPADGRVATRGFRGSRVTETFLTWPLWDQPLGADAIASLLALHWLQSKYADPRAADALGIRSVFRLQRILVGKTPNFTTAQAIL